MNRRQAIKAGKYISTANEIARARLTHKLRVSVDRAIKQRNNH
jgi:hypothetical protein